ncbi:paraquat-inducible protein A [Geminicoccus flavidas]|uniref:paraquat-inducible protein A n=1 Tax=Geminicoccus flavidas TaxID=2506407 RepID=UPI002AB28A2A|nr:paraquat-inducible protein A [Geminicoccus flavidas]
MTGDQSSKRAMLLACHDCGGIHRVVPGSAHGSFACATCGRTLFRNKGRGIEHALALNLAALVLFGVANIFPIMSMSLGGQTQAASLAGSVVALYRNQMPGLALLVFLVAIGVPLVRIIGMIFVLGQVLAGGRSRLRAPVFRIVWKLHPWAMTEVYLLGLVVAWVKLRDLATIEPGLGILALALLIVIMLWAESVLEPGEVWERIGPQVREPDSGSEVFGFLCCHGCGLLVPQTEAEHVCPRCQGALHPRKPDSLARTWALLIAAAILYIPANVMPVMTVTSLGRGEPDTILSGVKAMIALGMWPVAILVLFASIVVPCLKLIGLVYLLLSVQCGSTRRRRDRTILYRVIEGVGRWSMVDIFMISILVALVELGEVATIQPGQGAVAFAGVVVLTMLASASFDPRLIWNIEESGRESSASTRT